MTHDVDDTEQGELFDAVETDVQEVPLDAIEPTQDSTASLDNAIANLGTVSFPLLQLTGDDDEAEDYSYRIVDGRRRIATLRAQDAESLTAHVVSPEFDTEASALTAVMNIVRNPNPIAEARAIKDLIDNGYTPESLARIGIPKQTVKKRLRLAEAPTEIRAGVTAGDIAEGTAEKVANLSEALQRECAEHYEEEGTLRHKDVKEIRQANKRGEVEAMDDRLFSGPEVSRETAHDDAEQVETASPTDGKGDGPPTPDAPDTAIDIPTDEEAFRHFQRVAGTVRGYVLGAENKDYDDPEQVVRDAIDTGTRLGLTPEEVVQLLRTPPAHFLPDGTIAAVTGDY